MTRIDLPSNLDTRAAPELLASIQAAIGSPIEVFAGQVTTLGGQCLQILLCAKSSWTAAGHAFAITDCSEALSAQMTAFGVNPETFEPMGARL